MENNNKTEKINDYNGRDYRTVWQHPRAVFEDKFEGDIIKNLLTEKLGWFIDVGGGYGRLYPVYKKPGRKVVLVDYAMNLLEMAAEKYGNDDDLYFVAANAYHLPFRDEVFDGGISIRVFHHANLPEKFMKEVSRILRGQAEILIEYANKRNLFRLFRRGRKSLEIDHEEYEPLHYGTHPEFFKNTANEVGLEIKRVYGTGFFPRFIKKETTFLTPLLYTAEKIFDATFGKAGLGPLHFADCLKSAEAKRNPTRIGIENILQCPACGGELDLKVDELIQCFNCRRSFLKKGRIFDLRYRPEEEK